MNLEDYRRVFIIGSLVLMLIAASPTLGLVVQLPSRGGRFSEFWVLDPNHMAEDYPFEVRANESYSVFVGVENHIGTSAYYLIYVKVRNQTQALPNAISSEPSPLAPLFEFRAFVADGGTWEVPITFGVLGVSRYDDSVYVSRVSINDVVSVLNCSALWDSQYKGFYYQLFFELWLYNMASENFQFHDRFVAIWLNLAA
jgi:hypothetical protein